MIEEDARCEEYQGPGPAAMMGIHRHEERNRLSAETPVTNMRRAAVMRGHIGLWGPSNGPALGVSGGGRVLCGRRGEGFSHGFHGKEVDLPRPCQGCRQGTPAAGLTRRSLGGLTSLLLDAIFFSYDNDY